MLEGTAWLTTRVPTNPPGIRESTGADAGTCEGCQYFYGKPGRSREGDGECGAGNASIPVLSTFVCDLHAPAE